jgi:hypothetical protein
MMEGQFFFTTVAGLSLSIAGFASLIAWLREDSQSWDPINLWRVKAIVREAFTLLFLALLLIPVYSLTEDIDTTIRFGAGAMALANVLEASINRHPDPTVWQPRASWTVYMISSAVYVAFHVTNIWFASLGLLQIGFLLALISPAGIFYNFVNALGREPANDGERLRE